MDLKFVEAGHPVTEDNPLGGNWGKFAVGRWSNDELREPTVFPGCEGQRIVSLSGHGMDHIWVFDLQTGESARFHINNPVPVDVPHQLKKHQIWVCPMFEPFMVALWQLIRERPDQWWETLPRTMFLPDAPAETYGYRRPGQDALILEKFAEMEVLLKRLLGDPDEEVATSGGVPLTDKVLADLAAEAEAGYDPDRLQERDAGRPRTDADVAAARRILTHRSLDAEQI